VADRARLLDWITSLPRGWDTLDVLTIHRRSRAKVYAFLLVDQGWWQMAEFDGSRSLGINADVLWAVVADPARLADWVPTMRLAQPAGKEEVHVEGESHGHRYSLDSLLRIDESERRLHWGAEGDDSYRGSLRVTEQPSGSEVHLHVTIPDDHLGPSPDSANAEIRRGIEETFDRLAGLIAT
jgi:Polyketide cyclase / dehydrase and lipid transport